MIRLTSSLNKILTLTFFSLIALRANCQRVKISVDNNAFLITEFETTSGSTIIQKDKTKYVISYKLGYVPEVINLDDVFKDLAANPNLIGLPEHKISLKPVSSIPVLTGSLKGIKFAKFADPNGKIGQHVKPVGAAGGIGYGVIEPNVGLTNPKNLKEIDAKFMEYGYNVVQDEVNVFNEKKKDAELYIAAEILEYRKETKGTPGYIISVILKWSVYDPTEEKIIFTHVTGGYSNEQEKMPENEAFLFAAKNALLSLMLNPEFALVVKKGNIAENTNSNTLKRIVLGLVPTPEYNENSNYIENSIKSVVTIKSSVGGHGSGFLISSTGYILTNYHVIDQGSIDVLFPNGITLPAEVIQYNKKRDVALLKIPGSGYQPLALDTMPPVGKIGSDVIAIGTPKLIEYGQTVTKGIISALRDFENEKYIQIDASVNPGNSGGPLINKKGQVIGIVSRKGHDAEGIGLAIPINIALKTLNIELKN